MVDFNALANVKLDDLPTAPKMPKGSYIWSVNRIPEQKTAASGNGTNVNFELVCVGPVDPFDGDLTEVEEFEGGVKGARRTSISISLARCLRTTRRAPSTSRSGRLVRWTPWSLSFMITSR